MELNQDIKLKNGERIDVKDMQRNQRIMYFPKRQTIRLKSADIYCKVDPDYKEAIVLSASKAAKAYPELFFNSTHVSYDTDNIQTTIKLSRKQDAFCRRHGTLSGYIRELIDREMAKRTQEEMNTQEALEIQDIQIPLTEIVEGKIIRQLTFPEFERRCQDWFDENENRYHISDLRIWRTVPDSCTDNDVWYCIVNVRRGVNMILLYDHSGELDLPFEVRVDWARKSLNIPNSQMSGYTTHVGEYPTIEAAFCDMTEEPSPYLLSPLNDSCGVGRVLTDKEKHQNLGKMIDFERLSFLECLEKLDNWRNDSSSEWHGRKMIIFRHDTMSETIYTTQL